MPSRSSPHRLPGHRPACLPAPARITSEAVQRSLPCPDATEAQAPTQTALRLRRHQKMQSCPAPRHAAQRMRHGCMHRARPRQGAGPRDPGRMRHTPWDAWGHYRRHPCFAVARWAGELAVARTSSTDFRIERSWANSPNNPACPACVHARFRGTCVHARFRGRRDIEGLAD